MKRILLSALLTFPAIAADLPKLNLDLRKTTVSGVSSGGYMATQFHIAHSDWVKGAGVIAAGPYYCAQNSLLTALGNCINKREDETDLVKISEQINRWQQNGDIADLSNLQNSKLWLFSGTKDEKVITKTTDALYQQYQALVGKQNITYVNTMAFAHHFPTLNSGGDCDKSEPPYLGNCKFDAAGNLLSHLLGKLQDKSSEIKGAVFEFNQQQLGGIDADTLAETGFVYVPPSCAIGEKCNLHISFHGCNQFAEAPGVGRGYVENTGFNQWAESNRLVVLYPQTKASKIMPMNPQGCWDWWGYTNANYATRNGKQIRAIAQIVYQLAGKSNE